MKNFKKVVAAGLALLMLALSVNVSFAAENYTEKEAVVVAKVNAAGIMTGTDKGFEPSKTLTRAEAAAIMVRMKGISEDTVKQNAGTTLFTDVAASHWAAGYINVASNYGIIKGVGAGKFAPEKEVTVAEFYTMAVRALGAGQLVEAEGTWPTNYVNFAIESDLAEDVAQVYSAAATRITAATIVANTLKAPMWVKDSVRTNGEITWKQDKTQNILNDVLKIYEATNVLVKQTNAKKLTWTDGNSSENPYVEDAKVSLPGKYTEDSKLETAKVGMAYTVWYDKENVLGFWIPEDTNKTVYFENIKSTDFKTAGKEKVKLTVNGDEKEYDLGSAVLGTKGTDPNEETILKVFLNGASEADEFVKNENGLTTFGVAYLDKDNKVTSIYAESFETFGVVKEIKNDKIYFEDVEGSNASNYLKINKDDITYSVTEDGNALSIDDIEEGDAIYFYEIKDEHSAVTKVVIEVLNTTVEGKVKSFSASSKKATIDGTAYDIINELSGDKVKAGVEGTFYLDKAGKIVMVDPEDKVAGDLAIISAFRVSDNTYDDTEKLEVKLQPINGELTDWLEVNLDKCEDDCVDYTAFKYVQKDTVNNGKYKVAGGNSNLTLEAAYKAAGYGQIVSYKMKDGKVVFTSLLDKDRNDKVVAVNEYHDAKVDYAVTTDDDISVNTKSSTVGFELEDNNKTGWELVVTLKEIDLEELDTTTSNFDAQIADIDSKEGEFGVLVIYTGSNIKTDRTFAYIVSRDEYDDDDDDVEFNYEYKVLYAGETKTTTLYSKEELAAAGDTVELAVKGDEITKADPAHAVAIDELEDTFINKTYKNGQIEFVAEDNSNNLEVVSATISGKTLSKFDLAEDVIVIELDGSDYKVRSLSSLVELNENVGEAVSGMDFEDASIMVNVIGYTDDGETEIVAITYSKYDAQP